MARDSGYVLGLDIGTTSIGWAIVDLDGAQRPVGIRAAGVRCFDAGVTGDIESGKDESRAAERRQARQTRRQLARRAARIKRLFRLLQRLELLPPGPSNRPEERHAILAKLDAELSARWLDGADHRKHQLLVYLLRDRAVSDRLEPFELGRAIYHLAQRRGYRANRLTDTEPEEDAGKRKTDKGNDGDSSPSDRDLGLVKKGIAELEQAMKGRTLGQYFATLDPDERRIRQRWTSRAMYLDEFDRIWVTQAAFHPSLTKEAHDQIHRAIFFQRRLRSARHLIGHCSLSTEERCAPLAMPAAQEFRILQKVNDLEFRLPDGEIFRLTDADRSAARSSLLAELDRNAKLTFAAVRKLLKLPKKTVINLEAMGAEESLIGNRTAVKMRAVFGDRWDQLTPEERDAIVREVHYYEKPEALAIRARKAWGLDEEQAKRLSETSLEKGYASHCHAILRALNEKLRDGVSYATARNELGRPNDPVEVKDQLPPVLCVLKDLRNPSVIRAMTELRKVVNGLIRKHGKPSLIRIELARDLRRSRKQRKRIHDEQMQNRKARERAVAAILHELPKQFSSRESIRREQIEKVLLAEECRWMCPFTGKPISMRSLLGPEPQFDVAHLYPKRYLDDSFANKTLCHHEVNRHEMRDRLPKEAYGHDPRRWAEILARVEKFWTPRDKKRFSHGEAGVEGELSRPAKLDSPKLRRFLADAVPPDFVARQLNDTRYNSRLACEYLAVLYGGRDDESGTRRIYASAGALTAHARRELNLNAILGVNGEKSRADHRHHAVDAIAIAVVDATLVKRLADAAARAESEFSRRYFVPIDPPWDSFLADAQRVINDVIVSHRPDRRVAGGLHAETNYSPPKTGRDGKPAHHVRKLLVNLSPSEVDRIVDDAVRRAVQAKLAGGVPKVVFSNNANLPFLTTRDGRQVPIRKARVRAKEKPRAIGARKRYVASTDGSNHHVEVVAILGADGTEKKWVHHVVDRREASRRRDSKGIESVIRREFGPRMQFKFSLSANDSVEMDGEEGDRTVYHVKSVSDGEIQLCEHYRGNMEKKDRTSWNRISSTDNLRKRRARKVLVSPIGEVFPVND